MRLVRWFQRWLACWRLARQIQQGTLVAVTPDHLARLFAASTKAVAAVINAPDVLPPPEPAAPVVVQEVPAPAGAALVEPELVVVPNAPFQVRRRHEDEEPQIVAAGTEAEMKQVWRAYTKTRAGWFTVELYDVKLNLVRGSK